MTVTAKFLMLEVSSSRCVAMVLLSASLTSSLGAVSAMTSKVTATDVVSAAVGGGVVGETVVGWTTGSCAG